MPKHSNEKQRKRLYSHTVSTDPPDLSFMSKVPDKYPEKGEKKMSQDGKFSHFEEQVLAAPL